MSLLTELKQFYTNKSVSYPHDNTSESKPNGKYIFENTLFENINYTNNLKIETVTNFKNFKKFYEFPFKLYKNNLNWIPPFRIEFNDFFKSRNPFWTHADCKLFLAKKNNKIVGRIAGIIDKKFCENNGKKIGFFGFFECEKEFVYAKALLECVENWFISKDMNVMRGPIDGRIDIGCGFLCNGYDSPPALLSSYTKPYYITYAEQSNMKKARDFLIYQIDLSKPIPKKLQEKAQKCKELGITIRPFNRIRTKRELKWWISLFLQTFKGHWGYVPVSDEEVQSRFGVKQLRWFVDSKLFLVAEYNGSPVAYLWATPDYNQVFQKMNGKLGPYQIIQYLWNKHYINQGKLHFIGIKKDFRNKNIGSFLNYEALVEMKKRGYNNAMVGLIDEGNKIANKTIAITDAKIYKKYRVFDKSIKES
jgi:hypothetical protein